jgi:hypothetical protein
VNKQRNCANCVTKEAVHTGPSNARPFNAVIVPNIEHNTTPLCLQHSYATNNAIRRHKAVSNDTSLCLHHNLPFICNTAVLFPYHVTTLFNLTCTWCLRCGYDLKGDFGTPFWRSVEVRWRGGGGVGEEVLSGVLINVHNM